MRPLKTSLITVTMDFIDDVTGQPDTFSHSQPMAPGDTFELSGPGEFRLTIRLAERHWWQRAASNRDPNLRGRHHAESPQN